MVQYVLWHSLTRVIPRGGTSIPVSDLLLVEEATSYSSATLWQNSRFDYFGSGTITACYVCAWYLMIGDYVCFVIDSDH